MSTARQKQLLLLKEATDDIQKIGRDWASNGLELPVVFLVDWQDKYGKEFAKAYIAPADLAPAQAIRDGGMRADSIATVLRAMAVEDAEHALSQMAQGSKTLRDVSQPGKIIAIVVAFGEVRPYHVTCSSE